METERRLPEARTHKDGNVWCLQCESYKARRPSMVIVCLSLRLILWDNLNTLFTHAIVRRLSAVLKEVPMAPLTNTKSQSTSTPKEGGQCY